jgi:hypothetical protein
MPMAPYHNIDLGARVSAVRATGTALGVANNLLPASTCGGSNRTMLKFINNIRVAKSLPPLPGLDYTGFEPALNVLAALVP